MRTILMIVVGLFSPLLKRHFCRVVFLNPEKLDEEVSGNLFVFFLGVNASNLH